LGERGQTSAHAVELPSVGVGTAEHLEQDRSDRLAVGGQVACVEEHALGTAAAIEPGRYPSLGHFPSCLKRGDHRLCISQRAQRAAQISSTGGGGGKR